MMFITLVPSCQKQEKAASTEEGASLVMHIGLPSISLDTKANAIFTKEEQNIVTDPFGMDMTDWKDYEKLIDARVMYRLTMFLVDKESGALVGYRDLYKDSEDMKDANAEEGANGWSGDMREDGMYATNATVTFNYDHPLHKKSDGTSLEQLSRGPFRMIIVANWSPAKAQDFAYFNGDYQGLKNGDGNSFETYVESVISELNENISDGTSKRFGEYNDYNSLMDWLLCSDENFLCPITPQPLVLVQDIDLLPGKNTISGQLKRTWARVRVSVENLSNLPLTVHDISFGANTTRNTAYMFFDPNNEDKRFDYPTDVTYGSPNVYASNSGSPDALLSFTEDTEIKGLSSGSGNRKVLFDGYILESNGQGKDFTYNLNLEYKDVPPVTTMDLINDPVEQDLSRISEDMSYVIQNCYNQSRFLEYNSKNLQTFSGELSYLLKTSIQPEYRFKFEKCLGESGNQEFDETENGNVFPVYYIKADSGTDESYLGQPLEAKSTSDNIKLVSRDNAEKFTVRNDGIEVADGHGKFLSFWAHEAKSNGKRNYINVYGGDNQAIVAGWTGNDEGSQFRLYPVVKTEHKPAFNKDITLTAIDPETAHSRPLQFIRRNDFINILVTVSYNKRSGNIHFSVNEWNTGGGDIEFN